MIKMIVSEDMKKMRKELEEEGKKIVDQLVTIANQEEFDTRTNLMQIMVLFRFYNKRFNYVETVLENIVEELKK